ncbi:hypothetical protein ASG76_16520 [Nocardioides sp. Soil774]|uniref:hypothetical protein n=1 Tax=Nocardioides sp. Soil774 TaxID=1736408 RepID=UPI0006FD6465|nr:hypothetical protein [Nocardioides sp. Soil774]KRE92571.1 hypothetical protein ASG76_16520 [Nocardioides sp. Soil774]
MSQVINRRTVVRGAAWSIPVVAVAANAPAFAASTDAPVISSISVTCRTTGQGNGNCQGYRLALAFQVQGTYSWSINITAAQIVTDTGVTQSINSPVFPVTISALNPTIPNLWFCSASSPSKMDLRITYTATRTDAQAPPASTISYPSATTFVTFDGIPGC